VKNAMSKAQKISEKGFKSEVLEDYRVAYESRQASLLGRKEVLTGKAKFGIFGDGKEVAQVAMAKYFEQGDFRSGYYRDQTFMFSKGISDIQKFFAQLYAHTDVEAEPCSAGRSMNGHFGTRLLDDNGNWLNQTENYNSSADISPTAGQMPRLLGLAWASKLYRANKSLHSHTNFTDKGNEVAWGTIGNASTSEGHFWEVINAAGVLQVPMLMSIWDDEYGISVPAKYQTTKENLSAILSGFQTDKNGKGYEIFTVKGWDYPALCKTYAEAAKVCREKHSPVIIHVTEITQPQGHSTSGSHERYKSKARLKWEQENDCILKMREWILDSKIAESAELEELEKEAEKKVKQLKRDAWDAFLNPIIQEKQEVIELIKELNLDACDDIIKELQNNPSPIRKEIDVAMHNAIRLSIHENSSAREALIGYYNQYKKANEDRYSSHLYSQSTLAVENITPTEAAYLDDAKKVDGREVLNACFDAAFDRIPELIAFGEDLGYIGDVNQGFAGLQEKYSENRITDTGIREASILGQGIGAAMRGLRPIVEIQYLDYLLYALQTLSDDLATLQWRTKGGQKAPVIIRTRGHRLEGIWHSGSPMGMILNAIRGVHVLVPRNMTKAAGFYNTMLESDEPALIIECLNGYRSKELLPSNIGEYKEELGIPEVLKTGTDITLITYGSNCRIAEQSAQQLAQLGILVELIDVQTLLPFDKHNLIVESIQKTNKVAFLDEDVSGGATAYMMQKVLVENGGMRHLDSEPLTISSKDHRPAYGTDGDYYSKPSAETITTAIYAAMHEYNPQQFPELGV
jgi:pyruvate/2-oxoglutarate/acetoin dehydrogenase E1 component/TPP-dependent pyruvate/acetoin dehydrogenase alpha subunit